jgi:hypothetical protein
MNKRLVSLFVVTFLLCFSVAFAAVGIQNDGEPVGSATNLNFSSDEYSTDGSTFNIPISLDFIATGFHNGDVTTVVTGVTALPSSHRVAIVLIANGETLTLANGTPGQLMTIIGAPQSDTGSKTVTATTKYGWTSVALADVLDSITLLYLDDTYGWIIVGNNNLTITQ